jgi:integrase/recombinase XerD
VVRSWLELFLSSKRLRGLSEKTLFDYHLRIDYYLAFVAKNGLNSSALSTATIELYLTQRRATVSPFTIHGDFAVLRNFCGWLVKRHYLEVSPMLDLERPKKPRKRMRAVTYQQFRELYLSIKGDDWLAKRDRLILTILFFSGLRANELLKVQIPDIEEDGLLYIREGKGDRDRLVPFHPDVPFLARTYLAVRPPLDSPFLFASSDGSGGVRGVLQYEGLQQMIRRRCRQAKLPHYNLHSFRHGFAIAFLNADMQMSAVSAAMGHTSIDTTQIYARWSGTGLRTAYLAALARFTGPP